MTASPNVLRLVITVLTFRREGLLAALLPALEREAATLEEELDGVLVRVQIIDNDPAQSARPVVAEHGGRRTCYVAEGAPGISAGRNRALDEAADDDLLVFIDDDERPYPGWLVQLFSTYLSSGAGFVAGKVVSEFVVTPSSWVQAGRFFERAHNADRLTGSAISRAATNNLLLDLHVVRSLGVRFDADFGVSGSEDSVFTGSLAQAGVRGVWCAEAIVADIVPPERVRRQYVLYRTKSMAQSAVLAELRLRPRPKERSRVRIVTVIREIIRLGWGLAQHQFGFWMHSVEHEARGRRSIAKAVGALSGVLGRWPSPYAAPR